jgi:hypothetical protein
VGDGWKGDPENAPFDAIHVGASAAGTYSPFNKMLSIFLYFLSSYFVYLFFSAYAHCSLSLSLSLLIVYAACSLLSLSLSANRVRSTAKSAGRPTRPWRPHGYSGGTAKRLSIHLHRRQAGRRVHTAAAHPICPICPARTGVMLASPAVPLIVVRDICFSTLYSS